MVATWWAYGDESGIHADARYCSVLGYVGSPTQWKLFKRDWKRALGPVPYFHAKDFFPPAARRAEGSFYYGWPEKKPHTFLDGLLRTIGRYDLRPVGYAYLVADFMALSVDERRRLTGAVRYTNSRAYRGKVTTTDKLIGTGVPSEPYFLGFHYLITEALKASPPGAMINYVFDRRGAREAWAFQSFDFIKTYNKSTRPLFERLGTLTFDESPLNPALQAADLYAYCVNGFLHGSVSELMQGALEKLGTKRPVMSVGNAETFREILAHLERDRQVGIDRAEAVARRQSAGG